MCRLLTYWPRTSLTFVFGPIVGQEQANRCCSVPSSTLDALSPSCDEILVKKVAKKEKFRPRFFPSKNFNIIYTPQDTYKSYK